MILTRDLKLLKFGKEPKRQDCVWLISWTTDTFLRNQSSSYLLDFYFYLTHSFPMHSFSIPENIESLTLFWSLASESLTLFWSFQGVEKGYIGNEWVQHILHFLSSSFLNVRSSFYNHPISNYWVNKVRITAKSEHPKWPVIMLGVSQTI